jgi:hypothetical protein
MLFRRLFLAKGLEGLKLEAQDPKRLRCSTPEAEVSVTLRHPTKDEQEQAKRRADEVLCESTLEREPKDKVRRLFEEVSRREIPEGYDPAWIFPGDIDEDGRIRSIGLLHMEHLPAHFATYCRTSLQDLSSSTSRAMAVLRWRLGLEQGPIPVASTYWDDRFSFDGIHWFPFPSDGHSTIVATRSQPVSEESIHEITELLQSGENEPLPHTLFREAWSLRTSNPRSSLLIGVAAAEVAMKQYVSSAVPHARWLVENLPSPPIEKMAKDYLPLLPRKATDSGVTGIPVGVLDELKKAVVLRNHVAHKGEYSLKHESLYKKLLAVRDFLWLLDYFGGHAWALAYVRPEVLAGPPRPEDES